MRTLISIIAVVVLVDVAIVAWFAARELHERRRVRREIRHLDALWRAPAVPQLRLVHSAARRSAVHERGAGVTTLERPVLSAGPRARQASFAAFAAAMTALLVVLAFDVSAPTAERRASADGSSGPTWSFPPDATGDDRSADADGDVPSATAAAGSVRADVSAPPPSGAGGGSDGPAPERVAADPRSTDEIVLEWVSVPEADGYLIERWDTPVDAASGWNEIGETEAGTTTFVDTELEPGTTYYYRVSALTEEGTAAASDVVSATTLPGPPDAPVILATTNGSTVKVEWNDVSNETGYRVERSDASGGWAVIGTVGQDVTVYVDGGLEKGATYGYRVVATNESGESPPSDVVTATVGSEDATTDPGSQTEEPAGGAASTGSLVAAPEDAATTADHVTSDASAMSDEPVAFQEPTSIAEPTTDEPVTASESVTADGTATIALDGPAVTEASAAS